jgi:NAD(P)-dependent dehydrogenase (short-subunit alcohol dehydrogenase family)
MQQGSSELAQCDQLHALHMLPAASVFDYSRPRSVRNCKISFPLLAILKPFLQSRQKHVHEVEKKVQPKTSIPRLSSSAQLALYPAPTMSSPKEMWAAARNPPADPKHLSFKGKTVLVTGANSGLGHQAAIKYAAQGASKLILGVRTQEKGEEAKAAIISATGCSPDIFLIETLDLARFESVRDFAIRVAAAVSELHIVQLAGGIACLKYTAGPDGPALDLEVDALSPTLIAMLLLPKVRATADRLTADDEYCHISFVNSAACLEVKKEDLPPGQSLLQRIEDESKFEYRKQYFLIKLAAWYHMLGVADRVNTTGDVKKTRVILNASCPGMCKTNWLRGAPWIQRVMMNLTWVFFGRSAEQGARTLVGATGLGPESHGRLWTNDKIAP